MIRIIRRNEKAALIVSRSQGGLALNIPGLWYPAASRGWFFVILYFVSSSSVSQLIYLCKNILLLDFVDHSFPIAASLRDMTSVDTDLSRTPSILKRPVHGDRTTPLRGDNSKGSGERIHTIAEPSYFDEPPIE